jgi:hypothetical protein
MSKLMMLVACCGVLFLDSCSKVTYEHVQEVRDGSFKALVRTREFNGSGSYVVDVCVARASDKEFPQNKYQCFLNGYDFDGLGVEWQSPDVINVYFKSGRVAYFRSSASVYTHGPVSMEFHALLCDGCAVGGVLRGATQRR